MLISGLTAVDLGHEIDGLTRAESHAHASPTPGETPSPLPAIAKRTSQILRMFAKTCTLSVTAKEALRTSQQTIDQLNNVVRSLEGAQQASQRENQALRTQLFGAGLSGSAAPPSMQGPIPAHTGYVSAAPLPPPPSQAVYSSQVRRVAARVCALARVLRCCLCTCIDCEVSSVVTRYTSCYGATHFFSPLATPGADTVELREQCVLGAL